MVVHETLPDTIQEVDVVVAGGQYELLREASSKDFQLTCCQKEERLAASWPVD